MSALIGKRVDTLTPVFVDVLRLAETRLLITASSGGGKSYAIRKLLEQSHGKIQQIVIDIEGEFATLREKYDYILAGKGGDIPVDVRSAELLARKVLELGVSIIIDLYELPKYDRPKYVKNFCNALVDAPKDLWHPCLIIIDEAHQFAPQTEKAESLSAVIDLATRGRKRGFGVVLATQRLAKLNKDAAAELLNKIVGMTSLDIDRKRAADELGFVGKDEIMKLRDLDQGVFYAVGSAISPKTVIQIQIGKVITSHPKAGEHYKAKSSVPMPTSKIKSILAKFTDLPKEAVAELKTKQDMLAEIAKLRREVTLNKNKVAVPVANTIDVAKIKQIEYSHGYSNGVKVAVDKGNKKILVLTRTLNKIKEIIGDEQIPAEMLVIPQLVKENFKPLVVPMPLNQRVVREQKIIDSHTITESYTDERKLNKCERAILTVLATHEGQRFNKAQLGVLSQYSPTSGGFNNALAYLNTRDYLVKDNPDAIGVNPKCIQVIIQLLGDDYTEAMAKTDDSIEEFMTKLNKCERGIFTALKSEPEREFTKEELGDASQYSYNSGGFNNAIAHLNTMKLIERVNGKLRFSSKLLQLA